VLTLRPQNLFLDQGRAIVHEKGDKHRAVPFTRYTADLLAKWLAVRPPEAEYVFCSTGGVFAGEAMTVYTLNQILKRLAKKAGVKGRCNPHSFRHAFARQYLLNGGDLGTLSALMGHASVDTTVRNYARFADAELAALQERFSPLRNLGGEPESGTDDSGAAR
jgi:site-specific recombinase XerD